MTTKQADGRLERIFHLSERGTTVGTEVRAGVTTFLAMAYILIVNPLILSNAIDVPNAVGQLVTVTALAAAFGTLLIGLWANLPFALAPGMGLNAYFTFTVVLGMGIPWQTALGAVFLSGILFLIISLTGVREWILDAIPLYLKHAVTAGIGAFLAIIGFQGAGFIQASPETLVATGNFAAPGPWLALGGLLLTGILLARKVKGALLIGILAVTVVAILTGAPVFNGEAFGGLSGGIFGFVWPSDLIFALDIPAAFGLGVLSVVFTFLFVDFFDTAGTLIGLAGKADMIDEQGHIEAPRAAFSSDAIGSSVGAVLGTSTNTTYIESAAGIEEGGRTGLTSVVVAALFLLGTLFTPIVQMVPAVATGGALIVIGAMMMSGATRIDWSDYRVSIPGFLTIVGMPFGYSITFGIGLGIVAHTVLMALSGRLKEVHVMMWILAIVVILIETGVLGG